MTICPRCRAGQSHCRMEWQGAAGAAKPPWTVWHCRRCSFTWRDTEPARSIDYNARKAFARVDPDHAEKYAQAIPSARD